MHDPISQPQNAVGSEETANKKEYEILSDQTNIEPEPISAEKLKKETNLGGWLGFFLVVMIIGGVGSAITMITGFDLAEVGGNWFLAIADPLLGIMLFLLACYTLYSFTQRKPDAVFLAKTYVVAVFATGLIALVINSMNGGNSFETKDIIRPLIWGAIWFAFLSLSEQVKRVIPPEYRKIGRIDKCIVGFLIGIPLFCIVIGLTQLNQDNKKYEKERAEFIEKVSLADGEYTDGIVVFACPEGFMCEKMDIEGIPLFSMETATQGITIASEYNSDDSRQSAQTNWKESEDPELYNYTYNTIKDTEMTINGNNVYIKTGKYEKGYSFIDQKYVYRRFALIFNKEYGKMCLINCYDQGDDSYFDSLLNSIRFSPN